MSVAVAVLATAVLGVAGCGDGGDRPTTGASAAPGVAGEGRPQRSGGAGPALPDARLTPVGGGEPVTIGQIAGPGTPVVLNVWASWCVPCLQEMPAFDVVHRDLGAQVSVVGVTDDRPAAAEEMAERTGVGYPLLLDSEHDLLPELDIVGLPVTLFIDTEGTIVDRHAGELDEAALRAAIDELWGIS